MIHPGERWMGGNRRTASSECVLGCASAIPHTHPSPPSLIHPERISIAPPPRQVTPLSISLTLILSATAAISASKAVAKALSSIDAGDAVLPFCPVPARHRLSTVPLSPGCPLSLCHSHGPQQATEATACAKCPQHDAIHFSPLLFTSSQSQSQFQSQCRAKSSTENRGPRPVLTLPSSPGSLASLFLPAPPRLSRARTPSALPFHRKRDTWPCPGRCSIDMSRLSLGAVKSAEHDGDRITWNNDPDNSLPPSPFPLPWSSSPVLGGCAVVLLARSH